LIKLRK